MASQEYLYKMLLRQNYRNLWLTDLMSTIQADFSPCFLAPWCGPSVARVIYHAVGNVEKVDAQSSSFALRFSCALVILLSQIASCVFGYLHSTGYGSANSNLSRRTQLMGCDNPSRGLFQTH